MILAHRVKAPGPDGFTYYRLTIHEYYADICTDAALRSFGVDENSVALTRKHDPVEREWSICWYQPNAPKPPDQTTDSTDSIPW